MSRILRVGQIRSAAFGLAATCVAGAYLWLAFSHGTLWLTDEIVHENGRLTLGGTIGYVEHFLREWPIDITIALCVAGVVVAVVEPPTRRAGLAIAATIGTVLIPAVAVLVALRRNSWETVQHDLLQSVTREGTLVPGSHWPAHFLPLVCLALLATALAGRRPLVLAAWGWMAAMTVAFGLSTDMFRSAQMLGHQARELMTHMAVAIPAAAACALSLAGRNDTVVRWRMDRPTAIAFGSAVVVAVALFVLTVLSGSAGHAQLGGGWAGVIAAHVFEHSLDYAWISSMTLALVSWLGGLRGLRGRTA